MIKRFRMVAGPNGSGKTTLIDWLTRDYAVNFYTMLNEEGSGYSLHVPAAELPFWFRHNANGCI